MSDTPLHIPELGDKFVDYRQEIWGDSFNWSWNRRTTEIVYVVIHHPVTIHEATPDDIALFHKARGWGGIGYHFVITKDGKVWYVGDVGTARANVANMNEKVIGICMVGDFTKHLPSDEQIVSCHKLCKFFLAQPNWSNLTTWDNVVGHKELDSTACPGTSWDKSLPDNMWCRIRDGRPYTPVSEPEESSVEGGLDTATKDWLKFKNDLIDAARPPTDKRELPDITGWVEHLRLEAEKKKEIQTNYENFVKEVIKSINTKETKEEAVLEALRDFARLKNDEVKEARKKRLLEFNPAELLSAFITKLLRRG